MASLLGEQLFETAGQGPPPSKDFYQFVITPKEVIWRWWKISVRTDSRGSPPGEIKLLHQDFLNETRLQEQLAVVFGSRILDYTLTLCQGNIDYLERLPDILLLKIISYISLQDIGRLSQTSTRFRKLCNSEEIWKGFCDSITDDMEMVAKVMGWKNIFFRFYYNEDKEKEDEADTSSP